MRPVLVLPVVITLAGCSGETPVPIISEALGCGTAATAGGLPPGNDLQRHDLDLSVFPDALCNDGTGAVFYFRPYSGAANRNRWVIELQGGGTCRTPDDCANRWCHVQTNFGMTQMTSSLAPATGTTGSGILARRQDNPIGNWNQVFVHYCSSDAYAGTARDAVVTAVDPAGGGATVTMRVDFLGSRILDAVIATLRRDGVGTTSYTLAPTPLELPDLDEAELVLFAGASAGGSGVIRNVDRLGAELRAQNPALTGFAALIDSSFPPAYQELDFTASVPCMSNGLCTWEAIMKDEQSAGGHAMWLELGDESCLAWHAAHAPDLSWRCVDEGYVVRNHVTTPMFIRMGQTDELLGSDLAGAGVGVPGEGPLSPDSFARLVRADLAALATLPQTAAEGAAITVVPGAFGPSCSKHDTLSSNPDIFETTIHDGSSDLAMFDVLQLWLTHGSPSILVTQPGGVDHCAGP